MTFGRQLPPTHDGLVLVLDTMGVIYSVVDDVADLLCPFIHERNGETDRCRIESLYREASLGHLSADEFWRTVHLNPAVEDDYLELHELSSGASEFLRDPPPGLAGIWCLSNDVSEWSRKLRTRFNLNQFIDGFFISGDVKVRKPDPAIFRALLLETGIEPQRTIFVDDRPSNLDTAKLIGMETIHFGPADSATPAPHRTAGDFYELRNVISGIRNTR